MSAMNNLFFYDGASTPTAHTLEPVSSQMVAGVQTSVWREKLASVPDEAQVYAKETLEVLKSGNYKTEMRIVFPVMESISGQNAAGYTAAPRVAYEDTVLVTGYFNRRSTVAGRKSVRQAAINITGSIITSVVPVATGPVPELMDKLVMPT